MNVEEFLKPDQVVDEPIVEEESAEPEIAEIDVQKAVVESLAADKAEIEERVSKLDTKLADAEKANGNLTARIDELERALATAKSALTAAENKIAEIEGREIDLQERNPNALALLDREVELPDRFPGETRDHVLEVIKEARDKAEAEGRLRRAQILESVLVANEPNGNLAKRRAEIEKLFHDNGNIVSGPVLDELQRLAIPHKNGEEYLLPAEIIKRTY